MTNRTCTHDGCDCDVQAKGMCTTHWSQWYRRTQKKPRQCEWCGDAFESADRRTMCSLTCASAKAASKRPPASPRAPLKTDAELRAIWDRGRSEMRASFEESRWSDFISALRLRSTVTPEGCWEWQGQTRTPTKSASPYPVLRWARKGYQVHRLALEAKHGQPLGTQQAHHTCANTLCVNPEHLQAATHVENIAEMKARRSYELRIAELEDALRAVAPDHAVLNRIQYGQAV